MLFWRSFSHWVGGMGVLVFIMAIIPSSPDRTMHLLRAEMPGPTVGKLVPKAKDTAKILYLIYIVMTILQIAIIHDFFAKSNRSRERRGINFVRLIAQKTSRFPGRSHSISMRFIFRLLQLLPLHREHSSEESLPQRRNGLVCLRNILHRLH